MSAEAAPLEIAHHWNAAHDVNKAFRWALTAGQGRRSMRRSSCMSGPWSYGIRWTIHNRSLGPRELADARRVRRRGCRRDRTISGAVMRFSMN